MRIGFVIGTLSYSGAEKIMYHLIQSFNKKGDEVSVFLLSSESKYEGLPDVAQFPLYKPKMESSNGKIKRTLLRQNDIRKTIESVAPDIIVSFGVIFNIDLLEACRGINIPIIVCERNDPYNDPHSMLLRFRRWLDYPQAAGFVFQTNEIRDFFSTKIRNASVVIPNFIEEKVNKESAYAPSRNAFATSARLDNRQKDQISLISAFARFHKEFPEYTLEFYGNGPDEGLLKNKAAELGVEESVIFKGRVKAPIQYMKTAKAFILSSVYEGMPNALIEAMCYGMPCISSNCSGGGAKALIKDGENGILFNVGDVDALYKAMKKIASDQEFANKIGMKAFEINDDLYIDKIIPLWSNYIYSIYEKSNINK